MRDSFKRGAFGQDDASSEDATSLDPTPPAGRDQTRMFWESIGMKPGDDWKDEAGDDTRDDTRDDTGGDA